MEHRLRRPGERDLVFEGELLATRSSRNVKVRNKRDDSRWTEISIYRTDSGKYVTELIGRTDVEGDNDKITVTVCDAPDQVPNGLRRYTDAKPEGYLTLLALEALDEAGEKDPALAAVTDERI